jgi:hypothetical protein
VQRITPEPVALAMDRIDSPRQYAAFLLGGGSNRWSNLALVQAFSRVFTGRAVNLHVLRAVGPHTLVADPAELPALEVAREAVLTGLDAVVNRPWGTGRSLRGVFPPHVNWRAKTGTLYEREWNGSVFLWAGRGATDERPVCAAAGILTLEMNGSASPMAAPPRSSTRHRPAAPAGAGLGLAPVRPPGFPLRDSAPRVLRKTHPRGHYWRP